MGSLADGARQLASHPFVVFLLYVVWGIAVVTLLFYLQLFFGSWYSMWRFWNNKITEKQWELGYFCADQRDLIYEAAKKRCYDIEVDYRALVNDGPLLRSLESVLQKWSLCGDVGCVRYFGDTALSLVMWIAITAVCSVVLVLLLLVSLRWLSGWSSHQRVQYVNLPHYGSNPMHYVGAPQPLPAPPAQRRTSMTRAYITDKAD